MAADYRAAARAAAQRYGLNPDLFERQIAQESGFQPGVVSSAGARGIAQIMPATARAWGVNPDDPMAALDAAARAMAGYVQQYGSYQNALVAYNAGPGAVGKALLPETQQYLASILGPNYTGGSGGAKTMTQNALDPQTLLQAILASRPDPSQYDMTNPDDQFAYEEDQANWQNIANTMLDVAKFAAEQNAGLSRLQDGTIISQAQLEALDPASRAQVQAFLDNQQRDKANQYNDLLNQLGLTEFQTGNAATESENQRRSQDFQNSLGKFGAELSLDQANQETAVKKVDRQLQGLAESRARASQIMDTFMKAAPWMTSAGKTSFTPGDLGAAVSKLAQFGGIGANTPLMNFTGLLDINPQQQLDQQDAALGVTGQLPGIPDLRTTYSSIPNAPSSIPINTNAPQFISPLPPATFNIPTMPAPPPISLPSGASNLLNRALASLLSGSLPTSAPAQYASSGIDPTISGGY